MSESQREFQKYAKICFKTVNALLYEVKEINKKLNADDDNELYHVVQMYSVLFVEDDTYYINYWEDDDIELLDYYCR